MFRRAVALRLPQPYEYPPIDLLAVHLQRPVAGPELLQRRAVPQLLAGALPLAPAAALPLPLADVPLLQPGVVIQLEFAACAGVVKPQLYARPRGRHLAAALPRHGSALLLQHYYE